MTFLGQRLVVLLAVAGLYGLGRVTFVDLGILLGHGHFAVAYVYRWRGGQVRPMGAALYVLVLGLMFGLLLDADRYVMLSFITTLYLATHVILDESYLAGAAPVGPMRSALLASLLGYGAAVVDMHFDAGVTTPAVALSAAVLLGCTAKAAPDQRPLMLALWGHLGAAALVGILPPPVAVFNVGVGLFHYGVWYTGYAVRTRTDPGARRRYLRTVLAVHAATLPLFIVHKATRWQPLDLLFAEQAFLIWAFMHFFSSTQARPRPRTRAFFSGPHRAHRT